MDIEVKGCSHIGPAKYVGVPRNFLSSIICGKVDQLQFHGSRNDANAEHHPINLVATEFMRTDNLPIANINKAHIIAV